LVDPIPVFKPIEFKYIFFNSKVQMLRSVLDPFTVDSWKNWKPFGGHVGLEVDMKETDNSFILKADCPGLRKEDFKVDIVGDNVLRISGEKKEEKDTHDEYKHIKERKYGRFERSLPMPGNANLEDIHAKYENGCLTICVQKIHSCEPSQTGNQTKGQSTGLFGSHSTGQPGQSTGQSRLGQDDDLSKQSSRQYQTDKQPEMQGK
jgi:HSP20 family molecular chaperone IbpA